MDSLLVEHRPVEGPIRELDAANALPRVLLGLLLVAFGLAGVSHWPGIPAFLKPEWAGAALLGLAAGSTLASLARRLPLQNVVASAALIALMAGAVEVVGISMLQESAQVRIRQVWQLPLVWVVGILNCRGVARWILRRWRLAPGYGFLVMGGTGLLTVLFILGFARFGPLVIPHVSEAFGKMELGWQLIGALLACTVGTFFILVVVTPGLINKKPVAQRVDWYPLVVWALFDLWFLAAALGQGGWFGAGLIGTEIVVVGLFVLSSRGDLLPVCDTAD